MAENHTQNVEDIIQNWHIFYQLDLYCNAQSDGGIDYNGEYMTKTMSILPEMVALDKETPIAVSFGEHLFYFDDLKTHTLTIKTPREYVGGWGYVTKTHHYTLTPGSAPANSFPATWQT